MSTDESEVFDPTPFIGLSYPMQADGPFGSLRMDLLLKVAKTHKIEAIKILRETAGLGLKDAKDVVEILLGISAAVPKSDVQVNATLRAKVLELEEQLAERGNAHLLVGSLQEQLNNTRADYRYLSEKRSRLEDEVARMTDKIRRIEEVARQLLTANQALTELVRQEVFGSEGGPF